jgi:4-hydroxy-tetrahydrodipicolinate synthase
LKYQEDVMKNPIFKGIGTALVTPMTPEGKVDYAAVERLVQRQLEANIDALIICATTGEAPTLADDEHIEMVRFVAEMAKGKTPIIAGTGSNYTDHAVEMSIKARDVGADGLLCVTPYYNKCTQRGLVESYTKIADATELPVIVYNVPGRTGVNIKPATYDILADHPRIVGIKEANGDISSVVDTMARCRHKIDMYSGNDDQIVAIMAMGGIGCISVLSNVLPAETRQICNLWFEGKVAEAAALQMKYKPLIDALFSEVNPIPVKAALAAMGLCSDYARLPLTSMEDATRQNLLKQMREVGIEV